MIQQAIGSRSEVILFKSYCQTHPDGPSALPEQIESTDLPTFL